ncbi:MAG: hypothetical protein N2489_06640 [Clostridia bacterium]|nr:hypothetical protein [Clostridia bacterium]
MFNVGERVKLNDTSAIVLTCLEDEVLVLFERGFTKWIDKCLLELLQVQ